MNRPLRSWMFVPGNIPRFLEKIYEIDQPPDVALFDLEDGVLPENKPTARKMIAEVLKRSRPGPLRAVRVNAVGTDWFDEDMKAILVDGLEAICVPKVESLEDLAPVAEALAGFDGSVQIIPAIESANGLLRAREIAGAKDVLAIVFGTEDYALDLGFGTRREGEAADLLFARSAFVNAAAAAGVLSVDGVFPDLENPEGLLADVIQSRRLGFRAKSTFNPRQIDVINEWFSPRADELEYARKVVAAFEEAKARGDASVAVGGQLVDRPIVLRAHRLLELSGERPSEE